ncbi:MAG: hypothetical protein K2N46_01945 [Lachnospiraceae bacterium]|nr:hypothetical protein [Lachnospiraceae bacterium]
MNLTWNKGYEDYTDTEHWLPRLQYLLKSQMQFTPETAAGMGTDELLNKMEETEELLRFYCSSNDPDSLEELLKKHKAMLNLCTEHFSKDVQIWYLNMEYHRLNALLLQVRSNLSLAAESYKQALICAQSCFSLLQESSSFTMEQLAYIGWACVEVHKEASLLYDTVYDGRQAYASLSDAVPMLIWTEPFLKNTPGICDQAGDLYASIAGAAYLNQDPGRGKDCFERSIKLYHEMGDQYHTDFYYARSIWNQSSYGMQVYLTEGNPQPMQDCKATADRFLSEHDSEPRDRGIVLGALGIILMQESAACQQNGRLSEAVSLSRSGLSHLNQSLELLENDFRGKTGYYYLTVNAIAAKVFGSYAGGLDFAGVQLYYNGNKIEALQSFQKALSMLDHKKNYGMGESAELLLRAEIMEYLALLAVDDEQAEQVVHWGTQSADFAEEAACKTGNPAAWEIVILSSALVAEICLLLKNKKQAGVYAEKGLLACDRLTQIMPSNPRLEMRRTLTTYKKKAARRFF